MKRFVGVIGGMGPLAAADFLGKLAQKTPAAIDQDHIPVLMYGDCTIPDRSASIVGDGPSPLPQLLEAIRFLNGAGARSICIPCNSAHCWYDEMAAASAVPVHHIVRASAGQLRKTTPALRSVGVLSTFGTHQMGIYRTTLSALGFAVISPTDQEFASLITPAIALVKAGQTAPAEVLFQQAAERLLARGAEMIILGCTEIPLGMRQQIKDNPARFVDSTEALALAVIEDFRGEAQA